MGEFDGLTWFALVCGGLSFMAIKSTYWILKVLAGITWWALVFYWIADRPLTVSAGSAVDTIVIVLFIVIGIAFMFMPFWFVREVNGRETSGRVRLPKFFGGKSDEEIEAESRPASTWRDRASAHESRLTNAMKGRIDRR